MLSLGVAGMSGEPELWVCFGHRFKKEGTCDFGYVGFCVSLASMGVSGILDVGKDVVVSTVILSVCICFICDDASNINPA